MNASEKKLVTEILSLKSIKIPVYQRNYSWNFSQCNDLMRDIMKIYNGEVDQHFIGSIVYKIEDESFDSDLIIIDGQQRLTTIYILYKIIYDASKDNTRTKMQSEDILKTNGKINLTLNKEDNSIFYKLIEDKHNDINNKGYKIFENYQFFKGFIESKKLDIDKLHNSLQRLIVVSIAINQNENAQLIFESINSTGLGLSSTDLIRNYLLMNCSYDHQKYLFEKYWYSFEQKLGVENLTNFFRHFVSMKYLKSPVNKNNTYYVFKIIFEEYGKSIEDFFKYIEQYIVYYQYLIEPHMIQLNLKKSLSTQLSNSIKSINRLDTKVSYMYLINVFSEHYNKSISDEELVNIFKIVEIYIVRRLVCGYTTNTLQKIFRSLNNQILSLTDKLSYIDSFYYNLITKKKNTNGIFPTDDVFRNYLEINEVYKNLKLTNTLLYELEHKHSKTRVEIDTLTVEHIMPQKLTKQWKIMLGDNYNEIHSIYLHRLCNLTYTSINSELSNKPFETKVEELTVDGHLKLNQYFEGMEKWTEQEIIKRGNYLVEECLEIWSYPVYNESSILSKLSEDLNEFYIYEIDNFNSHGKLKSIVVDDYTIEFTTYKKLYNDFINYVFNEKNSQFYEMLVNNHRHMIETKGTEMYLYSDGEEHPYGSHNIKGTSIYFFNYYSNESIRKIIQSVSEDLELETKVIFENPQVI